jgi:hypothetical protein
MEGAMIMQVSTEGAAMRRSLTTALWSAILTVLVIGAGGCSEWSTYPTVEVKAGTVLARPESRTVVSVMAASVKYAQDNLVAGQDLAINLPKGANAESYDKVFAKLGGGRPMLDDGEPAIHLQEVRTRGMHAEADLIYSRTDGLNQLVTLRLERTLFETYSVKDHKVWQLRSVAAPMANYVPPPIAPAETEDPKAHEPTITEQPTATTDASTVTDVPRQPLVPG